MKECISIDDIQSPLSYQSPSTNVLRCSSSTLSKRNITTIPKPHSIFPSDFFASSTENEPQNTKSPLLPIFPRCLSPNNNQGPSYQSKIIIDFQKEFDEDKELIEMIEGKKIPRPNSEEHSIKPFSPQLKQHNKKLAECEIIPEVDEDKMRVSTKVSLAKATKYHEDNKEKPIAKTNNQSSPINIGKFNKMNDKNNESGSTTEVTNDSMKCNAKYKRRFNSGDIRIHRINDNSNNANRNITENIKPKKVENLITNQKNQLVLPSIRNKTPYVLSQSKLGLMFKDLKDYSEDEEIKQKLNDIMQNIVDIKSALRKNTTLRKTKAVSASHPNREELRRNNSCKNIDPLPMRQETKALMELDENTGISQVKAKQQTQTHLKSQLQHYYQDKQSINKRLHFKNASSVNNSTLIKKSNNYQSKLPINKSNPSKLSQYDSKPVRNIQGLRQNKLSPVKVIISKANK